MNDFVRRRATAVAALALFVVCGLARAADVTVNTQAGPVKVEPLAKLEHPWGMAYLPDGRLLITEKPGRLRVFSNGKLSEPVAGVPAVAFRGQNGLLDVAVDPGFAQNQFVYLSYAEPAESQPEGTKDAPDPRLGANFKADDPQIKGGAVARGKLEGNQLTGVSVIWRQVPKTIGRGHVGGRLVFAPDGKLFITSGERQRFEPAQDPASNLGAIVRVNPDGSIPTDNPFVGKGDGVRPDRYTIGNRNPLGAAIHPQTGKLWVNEMGPKGGDELLVIEPGKNYGWPLVAAENTVHYNDAPIPPHASRPEFAMPVKAWTPVISPSGMIFYGGTTFPGWKGSAILGGLSSRALIRVTLDGDRVTAEERIDMKRRIRDVIETPDGALLVLSDGKDGELLRLTPATPAAAAP
jgi:glucose/arabinose dehydrogenase